MGDPSSSRADVVSWMREQASASAIGPRLRTEHQWTMTDEEVEAVLAAAEGCIPRWAIDVRLPEWGEDFARNVARLGGLHVGHGDEGDEFWVAGPPGAARPEIEQHRVAKAHEP